MQKRMASLGWKRQQAGGGENTSLGFATPKGFKASSNLLGGTADDMPAPL